jgi:hypothetical protein
MSQNSYKVRNILVNCKATSFLDISLDMSLSSHFMLSKIVENNAKLDI